MWIYTQQLHAIFKDIEHLSSLLIQIELHKVLVQVRKQNVKLGFVIIFILIISENMCSTIPYPLDVHNKCRVKKTVYIWSACIVLYFPAAWLPSGDSCLVSHLSSDKHGSLPYAPLTLVYVMSIILIWWRFWHHQRTYPSIWGYYNDAQLLDRCLYSIMLIDCLFVMGKRVRPRAYSAGHEKLFTWSSILLGKKSFFLIQPAKKKSPYSSQRLYMGPHKWTRSTHKHIRIRVNYRHVVPFRTDTPDFFSTHLPVQIFSLISHPYQPPSFVPCWGFYYGLSLFSACCVPLMIITSGEHSSCTATPVFVPRVM